MQHKKVLFSFTSLALIILVATIFRFVWLNEVPSAVGGDEIVYILNAKASFLTGYDIYGEWSPLKGLVFSYPRGETQAELPYILDSFFVGPLPFSPFASRLPNALMGIGLIVFVYLVTKELLGKKVALFAAAASAINPWLIYIGRTAYEATPAMLFYFISMYVLLKAKGWKILLAFPFLALAFYSYIATKLFFLPFIAALIVYCYFHVSNKKYLKQYLILFALCVGLILFFIFALKLNPSTARLGELLTPNSPGIASQVNELRKDSMPNLLTNLIVNKYTILVSIVAVKTLKTFSADFLFVNGDEFFSLYRHGLFYFIDSIFVILGTIFIFIKKRGLFVLLAFLIFAGVIPQIMHTADISNFSVHATMAFVFMTILIGAGIGGVLDFIKNKKLKILSGILILGVYLLSVINFANIYFYNFPLQGYFDFPLRIVSNEAFRSSQNQKVIIYSNTSFDLFKKYLFYTNQYTKENAKIIEANLRAGKYTLGNVNFSSCDKPDIKDKNKLSIIDVKCSESDIDTPHLTVARLKDGGESYKIFNDKICTGVGLNRYAQGLTLPDFNIESLSNAQFCRGFITSF